MAEQRLLLLTKREEATLRKALWHAQSDLQNDETNHGRMKKKHYKLYDKIEKLQIRLFGDTEYGKG